MRKLFLTCASLIAALAMMGPASASAAPPPQLAACLGATQADGSFTPQEIHTGSLPQVGLALSQQLCVLLNPAAGAEWLTGLGEDLSGAEPPSEPPTQEEIQAIVDAISGLDPSNPLAVLVLANTVCQNTGLTEYCAAVIGGALSSPAPVGANVVLDGESGSCFAGSQSGTGQMSHFGADRLNLEWTADYAEQGNPAVGVITGTATNDQFGSPSRGDTYDITGGIGPSCGAGGKGLVLFVG